MNAPTWRVIDLGRRDYLPVWRAMQAFTDARHDDTEDELWLVEHDSVFTLGQAGKAEHVLAAGDIPVLSVDRGGQVTWHGPGQLVAYLLVDLRRLRMGVRELVNGIEQAGIDALARWGIAGERRCGAPGVYVQGAKVLALGLRVRRGCSFHGLAFNVCNSLEPYTRINPCGHKGLAVTRVLDLGGPAALDIAATELTEQISRQLGLEPRRNVALPNSLTDASCHV